MIDQVSRLQVSSISTVTDQGLSWKLLFLNLEKIPWKCLNSVFSWPQWGAYLGLSNIYDRDCFAKVLHG